MLLNGANISDPTSFNQLLGETLNALLQKAASGQLAGKKFAVDEKNFTTLQTLYTLAQCTPDLTAADCNRCFQAGVGQLLQGRVGARFLLPSCNVRYETYSFYNETAVSLLSPPAPTTPSPTAVTLPPTPGKRLDYILQDYLRRERVWRLYDMAFIDLQHYEP